MQSAIYNKIIMNKITFSKCHLKKKKKSCEHRKQNSIHHNCIGVVKTQSKKIMLTCNLSSCYDLIRNAFRTSYPCWLKS